MGNALLHPTITKVPGRETFNPFRLRSASFGSPAGKGHSLPPTTPPRMVEHGSWFLLCLAGGADWASRQLPVARPQGPA